MQNIGLRIVNDLMSSFFFKEKICFAIASACQLLQRQNLHRFYVEESREEQKIN